MKKIMKIEIAAILLGLSLFSAGCTYTSPKITAPKIDTTPQVSTVPTALVKYQGQDGKNALELLKAGHKVETKTYAGMGEFVTSIDGVTPDSSHFLAFYVNGKSSEVGADAYQTKTSDQIEWRLEEIKK